MLDGGRGKELIQELPLRRMNLGIVVMSADEQPASVQGALKAGALGYLSQRDSIADIVRAIERACTGQRTISPLVSNILADQMAGNVVNDMLEKEKKLSGREKDVYRLMGAGKKTKEIATELGVSVKTVESHEHNIKHKLEASSNTELRAMAARYNARINGAADS
jgi:DNA-binding NarL/FixJ family response regulator